MNPLFNHWMRQVYLKYLKNALFLALCFAKTIFNFHALSVHTFSTSSQLGYMLCYTLNWVYECTHKALNLSLAFDVDAFFSLVSLESRGNWLHGARITREAHIKALNPCNQLFTCFVNPAQGSAAHGWNSLCPFGSCILLPQPSVLGGLIALQLTLTFALLGGKQHLGII